MPRSPNSRHRLIWVSAIAGFSALAAASAVAAAGMTDQIAKLLTDLPSKQAKCGGLVIDLNNGTTLAAVNDDELFVPASNQKVLVLAAAIDLLGPDASFQTVLGLRANDLVIIGDGDPTLGDAEVAADRKESPYAFVDRWAAALKALGRERIAGDLVVDATIFDSTYVHPDWDPNDLVKWYGAPIGGLNLANNCVVVEVWPGKKAGEPAAYSIDPPTPVAKITNRCKSAPGAKKAVPTIGRRPGTFELVLAGEVSRRAKLQAVSVDNPTIFAATAIRELLGERGVTIAGKLRFERVRDAAGQVPSDVRVVAVAESPLADALRRIGLDSQNMCAEAVLKRLGYEWARRQGQPNPVGSWATGREAIRAFLDRIGAKDMSGAIADGSGLSRTNRISARDFVTVLRFMHQHPQRDLFLNSLAGNVTGGTLRKRMDGVDGDVFAKTGYMRGIRSLTGYVHTKDDKWYAFSMLFNGFSGTSAPYMRIQQRVCQLLATNGARSTP